MNQMTLKPLPILGLALALVLALPASALAGKGGPPTGGESPNNLSLPGVQTASSISIVHNWAVPAAPVLAYVDENGDTLGHYSYGCGLPQEVDIFSYPNTTCALLNADGEAHYYMTADECVYGGEHQGVPFAAPCANPDYPLSRIYHQKVEVNEWWADDDGLAGNAAEVAYVDWGDALEASTFTTKSKLRVETQPYSSTIPDFDPSQLTCYQAAADPATDCKVGFQMWHVSGQGITEHWGVRAIDVDAAISYNYDSPFQIIKAPARLNITKMEPGDAECPQPGGGDDEGEEAILEADPPPTVDVWTGSGWEGTCQLDDRAYTVETSVGGKYVYGYNLDMRAADMPTDCPGTEVWKKAGYWRLTFYTVGDPAPVQFLDPLTPNVAPPASPSEVRELPRGEAYTTTLAPYIEPADDDRLYAPVVDTANNLTYLDICIVLKEQGGGGGGKKPR